MNYFITFIVFSVFFSAMAIGLLLAKKTLKKGCSIDPTDPDCACRQKGIDPSDCPEEK